MADNVLIKYSANWVFYQGVIADSARLFVYEAGTEDLADIFTDADLLVASPNPIVADSGGLMPFGYIGTTNYKVVLKTKTATDLTIDTEDNIPGAIASDVSTTFAVPINVVRELTADYSVGTENIGETLNCTPSTTFTVTLGSAATIGDGKGVRIVHSGTANQVRIVTTGGQTIVRADVSVTAFALVGFGHSVHLISDGANWLVVAETQPGIVSPNKVLTIVDRVSAAPSSPTAGALYIVSAAYSTFETGDVIESDGQGGFTEHTPPMDSGWLAFVQDEDIYYRFVGSAWVAESATTSVAGTVRTADQAAMEARTSGRAVTTDVQRHDPAHPKAWGCLASDGTLSGGSGVSSSARSSAGNYLVTLATAMSSMTYHVAPSTYRGDVSDRNINIEIISTTQFRIRTANTTAGPSPADEATGFAVFGDQ